MGILVQHMLVESGYRVLPYIDDFLVGVSPLGQLDSMGDVGEAHLKLEEKLPNSQARCMS